LEFLWEFDLEVKQVKGKENNALNRKFHVASMSIFKSGLREIVTGTLDKDENYLQVK
jgi:hypothetical protein